MKILLFANTDWYLYNFRRSLALALKDAGNEVILLSPPGVYGEKLLAMGFRWIPAPLNRRSLNPFDEIAFFFWLIRFLRNENVDLVHGFTIKCVVYAGIAGRLANVEGRVCAVAGMGYVFTNDDIRARVLRPFLKTVFRIALGGKGLRLILQNPDDVKFFQDTGLVDARVIRLIPGSGVDCVRFFPRAVSSHHRQDSARRMRVVLPARLLWDKGLAEFVDAARLLRAKGLLVDFLLAGAPDVGNPASVSDVVLQSWVEEGIVEFLGHVEDMAALYHSVDVVVLPSYREGLPKGLIEAAACALPIVTTDAPGCREVVSNEVDGLLVPIKNAIELAAAIERLCADPALRARLGSSARSKVLNQFDERIVVSKTIDVYRELMGVS